MERLEISVGMPELLRRGFGSASYQPGEFPRDFCWRAVLYRWNYQGSQRSFGQTRDPGIWPDPLGNYNHTAAWNSMSEDWLVVEAGGKRHLPGRY